MKQRRRAGIVRHRRKALLGLAAFDDVVNTGQSTFTADDVDITANSSSTATFTITARNQSGQGIPGLTATITAEAIAESASNSVTTASDDEIADDGVESSVITLVLRDGSDRPIPGIPASDCVLAVSGAGNTVTQPTGSTNASGVIAGSFVSTVAATKTASWTVRGTAITDTATVTVTGTPGPVTPDFFSDWSAATGTSATARGDGGKWSLIPTGFNVVTKPAALVAGMANVVEVPWDTGAGTALCRKGIPWGANFADLAVGSTRTIRWYMEYVLPDMGSLAGGGALDTQTHPIQDGNAGSDCNYAALYYNAPTGFGTIPAGKFRYALSFPNNGGNSSAVMTTITLDKNHWYRYEIDFTRTGTTTYRVLARIYDAETSGEPELHNSNAFIMGGSGSTTLTTFMASNDLTLTDDTMLGSINAGTNDQYADPGVLYARQGGIAVWTDQGSNKPYGDVDGEA